MAPWIHQTLNIFRKASNICGVVMFLMIFGAFILQVVMRYIFNSPLAWPDEAIKILYVWVVFWGAAFMIPFDRQISFDLVRNILPRKVRNVIVVIATTICAVLFIAAIPVTVGFIAYSNILDTPILEVPNGYIYLPFLFSLHRLGQGIKMIRLVCRWLGYQFEPVAASWRWR